MAGAFQQSLEPPPHACPPPPDPYLRLSATGVKAGLDPEGAANFLSSTAPTAQVDLGPPQWGQRLRRDQDLEVCAGAAHVHGHNWGQKG